MVRFAYLALPQELQSFQVIATVPLGPAPVPAAEKTDPVVAFASVTPAGVFTFELPAYDLASSNRVNAIHIVLVPAGQAIPDSAEEAIDPSSGPFVRARTDVSGNQAGGPVTVDASVATPGTYSALAIVEFES